jgi:hypothetical protein
MADIRTINIIPTQSVSGVPQVQGNAGAGTQGTSSLAGVASGTTLSGFIVNRDPSGNPILRTASNGDITFSSNFFLNIGSEVSIRVETNTAGTLAHILTVNGQPPEVAIAQSAFAQEPDVVLSQNLSVPTGQPQASSTTATTAPAAPSTAPTLTVSGTLVAQPQSPSGTTAPLPTGTQVTLKITNLTQASSTLPEEFLNYAPAQPADNVQQPSTSASYATYARAAGASLPPAPAIAVAIPANAPAAQPAQATAPNIPAQPQAPTSGTAPNAAPNTAQPAQVTVQTVPVQTSPAPANSAPANAAPTAASATSQNQPATQTTVSTTQQQASPPASSPQQPASTAPSTPQPAPSLTATVVSNESSHETNLQTPVGIIRLQPGTVLPSGSTVTFEITDTTTPSQATAANTALSSSTPASVTELAQQWTSLQQIISLLASRDPAAASDAMQNIMPWVMPPPVATTQITVPQNIPVGMMLFMAALRGGNFTNWLGSDNVQWLQSQGHDTLVKKADSEFMLIARQFTESQPTQWQPLFFPIAVGSELQQARLFVKRDRKQQGNSSDQGKKREDTRFVVEVGLSQLGELQMDGFVRKQEKDVQFDLIIRSLTPLPQEAQNDILQIYNNTGELAGYKGSLQFQAVREFPVNPMEEIAGKTETVIV